MLVLISSARSQFLKSIIKIPGFTVIVYSLRKNVSSSLYKAGLFIGERYEVPVFSDSAESEKTVEEKTKRTGLNANYPDAYVAAQYPHKYFNPIKATADLDLSTRKKS